VDVRLSSVERVTEPEATAGTPTVAVADTPILRALLKLQVKVLAFVSEYVNLWD